MNSTIKDVLAHPALKRLVFAKNRFEIERMRNILSVIMLYENVQSFYKTYKLSELTTRGQEEEFLHFEECPWTNWAEAIDLPDTCSCCYVKRYCAEIIKILNELNLDDENERLKTFSTQWPLTYPTCEDLAAAGFYYFGDNDRVRCSFCGIEAGKWKIEDDPMTLHKKLSPSCPHVNSRRRKQKNVSIRV